MDPGQLIAMQLILLYLILGPLVLVAIYVLFDSLSEPGGPEKPANDRVPETEDPALWSDDDVHTYLSRT